MGIFNYHCASSAHFLVFIGFPSGYYVLLFHILVFCYICFLYELLYIFFFFFTERQAAFSTYIGKFLTSSGPQFPMSSFSSNSIYSLLLIPFGGKLTHITFIFLSILNPRVLNLIVLMIRDDRLVNVGKAFRMSSRVLWGG